MGSLSWSIQRAHPHQQKVRAGNDCMQITFDCLLLFALNGHLGYRRGQQGTSLKAQLVPQLAEPVSARAITVLE